MPNVLVMSSRPDVFSEELRKKFEIACKKAWCSMGEGFNGSDVGGVLVRVRERTCMAARSPTLVFAYVDRGEEFDLKVLLALRQELAQAVRIPPIVLTCPTPATSWFADPIWAIAPAKD